MVTRRRLSKAEAAAARLPTSWLEDASKAGAAIWQWLRGGPRPGGWTVRREEQVRRWIQEAGAGAWRGADGADLTLAIHGGVAFVGGDPWPSTEHIVLYLQGLKRLAAVSAKRCMSSDG